MGIRTFSEVAGPRSNCFLQAWRTRTRCTEPARRRDGVDVRGLDGIPTQPAGSTVSNRNKGEKENAFFGVFDGHGGSAVAKFTGTTIHNRLASLESYSVYYTPQTYCRRRLTVQNPVITLLR